jgi:hypothetical protein
VSLVHSSVVPGRLEDVFAWHERPGAFLRLSPPWQPARLVEESASLRDGRSVIKLPGGIRWVAQHGQYDPPRLFVDDLVSLPIHWHHIHTFEPVTEDSTRVTDTVETPVPARLLRRMFRYRHRQLADDLAVGRRMALRRAGPMTVAVTGSSGLIGSALSAQLTTAGHRVIRLVRRQPQGPDERLWRPEQPDRELLTGVDAVVHLAGASIGGRFTPSRKREIAESRIEPTRLLAQLMADSSGAGVFVAASAIGFYGTDRGDEELYEGSGRGDGFLADVVDAWEAATGPARGAGVRVVNMRTGIVQSPRGGVLRLLRPLFEAGLGGAIGDGRQWLSWIDLDDLTDLYHLALVDDGVVGPLNAVAPNPVRNAEHATTLARVLRRPSVLRVPALGPKLLLGSEGARELALASQRVRADRAASAGHQFRRPTLEECLRHQLGRPLGTERVG